VRICWSCVENTFGLFFAGHTVTVIALKPLILNRESFNRILFGCNRTSLCWFAVTRARLATRLRDTDWWCHCSGIVRSLCLSARQRLVELVPRPLIYSDVARWLSGKIQRPLNSLTFKVLNILALCTVYASNNLYSVRQCFVSRAYSGTRA